MVEIWRQNIRWLVQRVFFINYHLRLFTFQKGTTAPQAAGRIHSDFEKGFIMAEVMHYEDFKAEGGENGCKVNKSGI